MKIVKPTKVDVKLVGHDGTIFLGGQGAYADLLDIFERIGLELRSEIDDYFAKYNR